MFYVLRAVLSIHVSPQSVLLCVLTHCICFYCYLEQKMILMMMMMMMMMHDYPDNDDDDDDD